MSDFSLFLISEDLKHKKDNDLIIQYKKIISSVKNNSPKPIIDGLLNKIKEKPVFNEITNLVKLINDKRQNENYVNYDSNVKFNTFSPKHPFGFAKHQLNYAGSLTQGNRNHMEDYSYFNPMGVYGKQKFSHFVICDGHGGHEIAKLASENLLKLFVIFFSLANKPLFSDYEIIKYTINEFENNVRHLKSGTTYNSVTIIPHIKNLSLICINIGDSRAVLYESWNNKITPLSKDHDLKDIFERQRIIQSGGSTFGKYVRYGKESGLMVTRSIGDFYAKSSSPIINTPVVNRYNIPFEKLNQGNAFVVLASDGVWGARTMTNEKVINYVKSNLGKKTLREISETFIKIINSKKLSSDNISMTIVLITGTK